MKLQTLPLLIIILIVCGCTQDKPSLRLQGTLGKDLQSQFTLYQEGDRYQGYFFYNNKPDEKITVIGTKAGTTLRLEEFNNDEQKLTGIFSGEFDGNEYKGKWTDPTGKSSVRFLYVAQMQEEPKETEKQVESKASLQISYEFFEQDPYYDKGLYYALKGTINGK